MSEKEELQGEPEYMRNRARESEEEINKIKAAIDV